MKVKTDRRLVIVVDPEGRIVGTAPADDADGDKDAPRVGVGALSGQTVHEVALTKELERALEGTAEEFHAALAKCTLRPGRTRSVLLPMEEQPKRKG